MAAAHVRPRRAIRRSRPRRACRLRRRLRGRDRSRARRHRPFHESRPAGQAHRAAGCRAREAPCRRTAAMAMSQDIAAAPPAPPPPRQPPPPEAPPRLSLESLLPGRGSGVAPERDLHGVLPKAAGYDRHRGQAAVPRIGGAAGRACAGRGPGGVRRGTAITQRRLRSGSRIDLQRRGDRAPGVRGRGARRAQDERGRPRAGDRTQARAAHAERRRAHGGHRGDGGPQPRARVARDSARRRTGPASTIAASKSCSRASTSLRACATTSAPAGR